MLNSQELKFSSFYSKKRINHANNILGEKLVKKMIAFVLYLLGVSRQSIADNLKIPYETLKSFTIRIEKEGAPALIDRRYKNAKILESPEPNSHQSEVQISSQDGYMLIDLGNNQKMSIPSKNRLQIQTILLTLLENNQINASRVSELLNVSQVHVYQLRKQMLENDITSFIDKRQGQQKDYIFNSEAKKEVIQQFAVNVISGEKTSSEKLSKDIKERCKIKLSPRSIRYHIKKLGLTEIKKTLPRLVEEVKKNSKK